ncbi:MAG: HNH endonuclease [Bdellovibrionales bacterium RBG_16_40_8]|nr:MAG: HNH endonuclease [Bdellovibrionales bacterium RBG_16_40_8]
MNNYFISADDIHVQREKMKARELRASQWWSQQIGPGTCHYCHEKFARKELTMDHIVPIIRGGKSTKSNIVVSCKACNSKKKYFTPVELTMQAINAKRSINSFES